MASLRPCSRALPAAVAALLLCLGTVPPAHAATDTTATAPEVPIEDLVELDEVLIRGRITANMLALAEDRVYRRYNRLNKNSLYDVHCVYISRERGSMIKSRICVPEFLASRYSAPAFSSTFHAVPGLGCNGSAFETELPLPSRCSDRYSYSPSSYAVPYRADVSRIAPQASLAALEQRFEFSHHMLDVIESDPELHEMAKGLARLIMEMNRTQAHYDRLRAEKRAARAADPRSGGGPGRHPGR